jgi:D-alanyl-D-alanine carboxypeptidase/D-alanyl-D-alanine-endopeptidase (penicillin-binding protein 4)
MTMRPCRHNRRILLSAVFALGLLLPLSSSRARADLVADLDRALGKGAFPAAGQTHYSARILDLSTGKELYAVEPDTPITPASNGKIAVGAATLDLLGSNAVFKTTLAMHGDDLWLIGTGDPGIGDSAIAKKHGGTTMSVLDEWAEALKKRNIQHIKGNLYYYDRVFDDQWTSPTWGKSYITDWYAAPISGLNFNNNCIDVSVNPTIAGQPVTYKVIPPTDEVTIVNKCVTGPVEGGGAPDIDREPDADRFTLTGATTKPYDINSKAIRNPGYFFADALRTELSSRGISIDGDIRRADKPIEGATVIAVHETRMPEALGRINKQSQNNFAEAFCKLLGREYARRHGRADEPGSWANGAEAVKAFLNRNHIDASKIKIIDGSGLSHDNKVTTRIISDVFRVMWTHPEKETWFNSLGTSGTDGTISSRMKDLKGRIHAKTGFINGVRSLSGYVQSDSGKWIVFSIIYNGIEGSVKPFEDRQDNACRILAAWPKHIEVREPAAPATRPATTR